MFKKLFYLVKIIQHRKKFRYVLYTLLALLCIAFIGLIAIVFFVIAFLAILIYSLFTGSSTTMTPLLENNLTYAKEYLNSGVQYIQMLQEKLQPMFDVVKQYGQLF